MTMLADEGVSLLGSAVVAAAIAAVVSLVTLAWNARRDRQDRQRRVFADAFEACILSREFPFIVRRRNADDLAAERARITLDLSRLQARLDSGKAILRVEAPRVGAAYAELVRETRRIAGAYISKAWDEPPLAADANVHIEGMDYTDLEQFDDAYLGEVSDHPLLLAALDQHEVAKAEEVRATRWDRRVVASFGQLGCLHPGHVTQLLNDRARPRTRGNAN
jgi:hypothetical protein